MTRSETVMPTIAGEPRPAEIATAPLRRAVADDVAGIRALVTAAYAKWVPLIGRKPEPMTIDYEQAVRRHRIDLVHIDDRLVALIGMVAKSDHLLIGNVAVHPDFQHRGLGRRLLHHAEVLAASLGLHEMRLYTNARFEVNVRLYERLGYRTFREETISGGGSLLHMCKGL